MGGGGGVVNQSINQSTAVAVAGLVVACDEKAFLLHGQGDVFQGGGLVFKDAGTGVHVVEAEAVVWRRIRRALVIAQLGRLGAWGPGARTHAHVRT